jgi:hypothetical protein
MRLNKQKSYQSASNKGGDDIYDPSLSFQQRVKNQYADRTNLPVIEKGSPEWSDWMRYFAHIGHAHAHENSYANKIGRLTVPESYPEAFDPTWRDRQPIAINQADCPPKSRYQPSTGKPLEPIEQERQRRNIERMFANLIGSLGKAPGRKAKDGRNIEAEKRQAQEWLDQQAANKQREEIAVSDRLTRQLNEMFEPYGVAAE